MFFFNKQETKKELKKTDTVVQIINEDITKNIKKNLDNKILSENTIQWVAKRKDQVKIKAGNIYYGNVQEEKIEICEKDILTVQRVDTNSVLVSTPKHHHSFSMRTDILEFIDHNGSIKFNSSDKVILLGDSSHFKKDDICIIHSRHDTKDYVYWVNEPISGIAGGFRGEWIPAKKLALCCKGWIRWNDQKPKLGQVIAAMDINDSTDFPDHHEKLSSFTVLTSDLVNNRKDNVYWIADESRFNKKEEPKKAIKKFKIGDRAEVINNTLNCKIGTKGTIYCDKSLKDGYVDIDFDDGSKVTTESINLKLIPKFKKGDKVKFIHDHEKAKKGTLGVIDRDNPETHDPNFTTVNVPSNSPSWKPNGETIYINVGFLEKLPETSLKFKKGDKVRLKKKQGNFDVGSVGVIPEDWTIDKTYNYVHFTRADTSKETYSHTKALYVFHNEIELMEKPVLKKGDKVKLIKTTEGIPSIMNGSIGYVCEIDNFVYNVKYAENDVKVHFPHCGNLYVNKNNLELVTEPKHPFNIDDKVVLTKDYTIYSDVIRAGTIGVVVKEYPDANKGSNYVRFDQNDTNRWFPLGDFIYRYVNPEDLVLFAEQESKFKIEVGDFVTHGYSIGTLEKVQVLKKDGNLFQILSGNKIYWAKEENCKLHSKFMPFNIGDKVKFITDSCDIRNPHIKFPSGTIAEVFSVPDKNSKCIQINQIGEFLPGYVTCTVTIDDYVYPVYNRDIELIKNDSKDPNINWEYE